MPALSSDFLPPIGQQDTIRTARFAICKGYFYQYAGGSGIGKTEMILQAAMTVTPEMLANHPSTKLGYKPTGVSVLYIMCSNYDEWTLRGVQSFKDTIIDHDTQKVETITVTAMPEWFRAYKELRAKFPNNVIVIFLDEIAVGVIQMQASLLQLITQKAINEQEIPEDEKPLVSFLAAFNRPQDHPVSYNMTAPLAMRAHGAFTVEPNLNDWIEHMEARGTLHPMIFDTLSKNPEFFHIKDIPDPAYEGRQRHDENTEAPKIATMNCVCPRNWTQLCDVCHDYFEDKHAFDLTEKDLYKMLSARVPSHVATVLMASLKVVEQLTDISEIVANPDTAKLADRKFMQTLQLYNLIGQLNSNNIDHAITYMSRMNETVKGIISTKVINAKKSGVKSNLSSKVVSKLLTSFLGQNLDNQSKLRGKATKADLQARMQKRADKSLEDARLNIQEDDGKNDVNPDLEFEV